MRVWDIPVQQLCNKHLLAQHLEIHSIYNIITQDKKGFAHHPEVMRWRGHLPALEIAHDITVAEMLNRRMGHGTPIILPLNLLKGQRVQFVKCDDEWSIAAIFPKPWQSVGRQKEILLAKGCGCLQNLQR